MWMGNGWAPKNAHSNSSILCASSAVSEKWCEGVVVHKKTSTEKRPSQQVVDGRGNAPINNLLARMCQWGEG